MHHEVPALRPRTPLRTKLSRLIALALVAGTTIVVGGASTPVAQAGDVCEENSSGKIDVKGKNKTLTLTAPPGQVITAYCVKAGPTSEVVTVNPPQQTVTISHSSGKDVSHYSLVYAAAAAPSYVCVAATSITATSATLGGSTSDASVTTAVFTLTPAGGTVGAVTVTAAAGGGKDVSAPATGLAPSTAYTYTIDFFNGATKVGTSSPGAACTFTTAAPPLPPPPAPTYLCVAPSDVTTNSATLRGSTTNTSATQARWTLTPAVGAPVTDTSATDNGANKEFSAPVTGLAPGTTYTVLVEFLAAGGAFLGSASVPGCSVSTTLAPPPPPPAAKYECITPAAPTSTSATVGGRTDDPLVTQARFVLTPAAGPASVDTTPDVSGAVRTFTADVSGLDPSTPYTLVVEFLSAGGAVLGSSVANGCPFTTLAPPSTYTCVAATNVTFTGATIGASTTNANAVEARFTLTPAGGTAPADTSATPNGGAREFSTSAAGLTPGTSYTFSVGFYDNTGALLGTATGTPTCAFATLVANPSIVIVKYVNQQDADALPGASVAPSSPLAFSYVVTNNGDVPLSAVTVTDDKGVTVTCPTATLNANETMTCTGSATAPATGTYTNVGTVVGTAPGGTTVTDDNPANATVASPAVAIRKLVNGDDADVAPGPTVTANQLLDFEYIVSNTGNVGLVGLAVTDDKNVVVTCPATTLAIGASMTCTGTGPAPASGDYRNVGTVTGTGAPTVGPQGVAVPGAPVTADNPAHVTVPASMPPVVPPVVPPVLPPAEPAIEIVKKVNGLDANTAPGVVVLAGSTMTFTYEVRNSGNTELTNIGVTDDRGVLVSCPSTTLAAGFSMICTGTAIATTAGQYTNVGVVTATPPSGPPVTDDDRANAFVPAPAIEIVKLVNGADADTAPGLSVPVGTTLTWTYRVTNTGNVPLGNIRVVDDRGVKVDCGGGSNVIAALAAGQTASCTGTGVAVEGPYVNVGVATGTPQPPLLTGQPPVTLPDVRDDNPAHHTGTPNPVVLPPVAPELPPGTLPQTGSSSGGVITVAAILVALGALLVMTTVVRRRRPHTT